MQAFGQPAAGLCKTHLTPVTICFLKGVAPRRESERGLDMAGHRRTKPMARVASRALSAPSSGGSEDFSCAKSWPCDRLLSAMSKSLETDLHAEPGRLLAENLITL